MRRVAIVGFAPSFVDAPFHDPSVEIWTMNYHHLSVPRSDRVFELHWWSLLHLEAGQSPGVAHDFAALKALTVPVYMQEVRPEVPASVRYPIEVISAKYTLPGADKPYLTNTASYMIALALEELNAGDELYLYGVDMAHDSEYAHQRPSCEFWLGIAVGKGIKLITHPTSDLLKTAFLYGYEEPKQEWFLGKLRARREHLTKMRDHHQALYNQQIQAVNEFNGALQDINHIIQVWGEG